MTQTNTDDTGAKGSQITTVQVSFEDFKQVIRARQEHQNREEVVLRISPTWRGFDDVETAKIGRRDPAVFYPDGKPHINLHPGLLYGDEHPLNAPELAQYPNRLDERRRCRDHHGLDMEKDIGDRWDEWWEQTLRVWEGELKSSLREEIDLHADAHGPNAPSVTVEIEWTDLD